MHLNRAKLVTAARLAMLALYVLQPLAQADDHHISCPTSVDARELQTHAGSAGISRPAGKLELKGAEAIYVFGSLADAPWGELKDPPSMKRGAAVIARYDMPADADKYVICHYGEHSYRAIKLPAATQACDVIYSPAARVAKGAKATYGISDIVCR